MPDGSGVIRIDGVEYKPEIVETWHSFEDITYDDCIVIERALRITDVPESGYYQLLAKRPIVEVVIDGKYFVFDDYEGEARGTSDSICVTLTKCSVYAKGDADYQKYYDRFVLEANINAGLLIL